MRNQPRSSSLVLCKGVLPWLVIALTGLAACASAFGKQVLEYKDISQFTIVEETSGSDVRSFRLKGLAFHSALAVSGHEAVRQGDKLRVRVFLSLAKKGSSGDFDFVVEAPEGVRQVLFGDEGYRIWTE